MSHTVIVERRLKKRIKTENLLNQVKQVTELAIRGQRGVGWTYSLPRCIVPIEENDVYINRAKIEFTTTSNRESLTRKWDKIVRRWAKAGCAGGLKGNPWSVVSPSGYEIIPSNSEVLKAKANEPKNMGDISLDPDGFFTNIFDRDAQIRRIIDSLALAKKTNFLKRNHSLLSGPPGCGKSQTMLATAKMLGEEGAAWLWFDATSMTKAGAIEEIISSSYVPPVCFIEEIEKCEESSLRWLLGIMDLRAEIRRTNYRVGNQAKNVHMVIIASANDVKLLKNVMSGALYSRFQNKIYFPRPNRSIMEQILHREIAEIGGNPAWIEPALQFGFDKWGITDPRDLTTICTCGADRLLTGKAQEDYELTMHPTERKALQKLKRKPVEV